MLKHETTNHFLAIRTPCFSLRILVFHSSTYLEAPYPSNILSYHPLEFLRQWNNTYADLILTNNYF